jgi:hypothetical protein
MTRRTIAVLLALASLLAVTAFAQRGRDPLTSQETDALREAKQDPPARLKLYVKYARARVETLQHLLTDPRFAAERGPQVHDLLGDIGRIIEEMDDNVDMYSEGKYDIRKPLKDVVQADTEFQLKLRQIKETASTNAAAGEELRKNYQFALDDTLEAVNSSLDGARKTLDEQEEMAKKKELRKTQ